MYIAQRTRHSIRIAGIVAVIYVVVVAALAWAYPGSGSFGVNLLKWLVGVPFVLVVYGMLEWGGDKLLSLPWWDRMPSAVRVILLALLVTLVAFAVVVVWEWHA